jgi:hypothetical protein
VDSSLRTDKKTDTKSSKFTAAKSETDTISKVMEKAATTPSTKSQEATKERQLQLLWIPKRLQLNRTTIKI